jgi:clan AA aspartic protease (TIGR02281 family)
MWFIIEGLADMAAGVEWSSLWNVTLGALLAMWVTHQEPSPAGRQGRQISIPVDASNGCHTDLTVNGHVFRMLLDTGATGMPLVFGSNQADDLDIDEPLEFSYSYSSANGIGKEALVHLRQITLSGWTLRNVPAVITQAPQDEGLLGAEFLHRLNFTLTPGYCTLSMPVEARIAARPVHHRRRASE